VDGKSLASSAIQPALQMLLPQKEMFADQV
jgi:hypothetical protein